MHLHWGQLKNLCIKASELVPGSLFPHWNWMRFFCEGITIRLKLTDLRKICNPVLAKFKHVTNIDTLSCMLLCCDWIMYVLALWNFQKADFEPHPVGKKIHHFLFSQTWGIRFKYLPEGCPYILMYSTLYIMQWFSQILDVFTPKIKQKIFDSNIFMNQKWCLHKTYSNR